MKAYSHNSRKVLTLTVGCLLFSAFTPSQAVAANAQRHHTAVAHPAFGQPGGARLIIWRIPNLGNRVVVNLWLDGAPLGLIVYGQTYDGFLPLGRHILSVTVSPFPKWPGRRMQIALNVRDGQTYCFTAIGDHSGDLILKPELGPTSERTSGSVQYGN
jgi:hypothetical protein